MLVDAGGYPSTVDGAAEAAVRAEKDGYDGWFGVETMIDVLLACGIAAERTERIEIGSGIAVAFSRNPMTMAQQANDLQALSGGRFILGLGSQIKPHIVRRFSMEWSKPAARMREFVEAIRAIWGCWETGEKLDFRGEFYSHTLMTPFFNPGPNPYGAPRVLLAGVGQAMTRVAGEVADGFLCHGFTTERYLREVTLPALTQGRADLAGFEVSGSPLVVTGRTEEEMNEARRGVREQIAFYGSTPAYRPVLERHGWGALSDELHVLSRQGRWQQMGTLVDDQVLDAFAVTAAT